MSAGQLDHPSTGEALSDDQWWQSDQDLMNSSRNLTSDSYTIEIPFGQNPFKVPVRFASFPSWANDLLLAVSRLGDLEHNWDSYGAQPIDPQCAAAAVNFILSFLDSNTPEPSIVPVCHGGIQIEWHTAGIDLEIEIISPSNIEVFFEDEGTGQSDEMKISDNYQPLVPLLQRLNPAG